MGGIFLVLVFPNSKGTNCCEQVKRHCTNVASDLRSIHLSLNNGTLQFHNLQYIHSALLNHSFYIHEHNKS